MKFSFNSKKIFILIAVFGLMYSVWAVNRHNHFLTDAVDLGIYDQPIWNLSQLRMPFSSIKNMTTWGDHVGWVIIPLAPFYWIWNDVRMLLILQALIVAVAAYPIYKLAKLKLKSEFASLAISFVFLSFVGIQTALDYDFHLAALSVTPIAFTLYFLHTRQWKWYWPSFFIAMATKEDVPLIMLMVGLYALIVMRKYKVGLASIIFAGGYYFILTSKIIPYFKGGPFDYEQYDPSLGIGSTTGELITTMITNPLKIVRVLTTPDLKVKTTVNLIGSYGFLPLLSPANFLISAPIFMERFLNNLSQRWLIRFQYSASIDPILAVGTILGIENAYSIKTRFSSRLPSVINRISITHLANASAVFILASNLFIIYRTNAPIFRVLNPQSYGWKDRYDKNNDLINQIPTDASVLAQSSFVPHLSHRDRIYRFQDGDIDTVKPDYVILNIDEQSDPPYVEEQWVKILEKLRTNSDYEILYDDGRSLLMKRI